MTYYLVIKCNFSTQSTCRTNIMHTCGKLINSRHQIMSISDVRASSFQALGAAKFASDGRTGSRVGTYLCTNRNLKFQRFLLVMCEPQVFGRAGGPRLGLNISLISIFLKSLNNVLIVLQYIQLLL